jgi:hypothetical protein
VTGVSAELDALAAVAAEDDAAADAACAVACVAVVVVAVVVPVELRVTIVVAPPLTVFVVVTVAGESSSPLRVTRTTVSTLAARVAVVAEAPRLPRP